MIDPDAIDQWLPLDDVKKHLRVEDSNDDEFIEQLVYVAVEAIEGETGHLVGPREVVETFPDFRDLGLRCWPVLSLTSVSYRDRTNAVQTVADGDVRLVLGGRPVRLAFASCWPPVTGWTRDSVTVTYQAGYAPEEMPHRLRAAALLMIGDLYGQRESWTPDRNATAVPMSLTVESLLRPFRLFSL